MILKALLNTDGGSRGNPGPSGIGFILRVDDGRELQTICRGGAPIGKATNNVAEYQALLWGLRNALALRVRNLTIHADSELLVRQVRGEYKVKNAGIKPLHAEALALLSRFASHTLQHVMRAYNAEADALANEAMDAGHAVGDFALAFDADAEQRELFPTEVSVLGAVAVVGTAAGAGQAESQSGDSDTYTRMKGTSMIAKTEGVGGVYSLSVKEHFDAAHALVGYPGECRNLHGHTWDVEAVISGTELDEVGIVYDFKKLKSDLLAILDAFDHHYLNEVPPFDTINATAENLARVVFEQLAASLPDGIVLDEVSVWESPIAKLSYRR
jgi:queuosine biosynthesis protein QueD